MTARGSRGTRCTYASGTHAPGRREPAAALRAAHHLLLAHGDAARVLHEGRADSLVGIALNPAPIAPASDGAADREAARRVDGLRNRLFAEAILLGRYPADVLDDVAAIAALDHVLAGDLERIAAPIDLLGINYYYRYVVAGDGPVDGAPSPWPGAEHVRFVQRDVPRTALGWPIEPDGLRAVLAELDALAPGLPLYVTENGGAFGPGLDDADRIAFLDGHLRAARAAVDDGIALAGYFVWSLLDNFEWAEGYSQRFGIVHVDYETQERTPRASAGWYREVVRAGRLPDERL